MNYYWQKRRSRNFLILILSCVLALISFSCEKEIFGDNYDPTEYFPLNIGSYWVYETSYTGNGASKTVIARDSIIIKADTTIYGSHYYFAQGTWLGNRPYNELLRYVQEKVAYMG